MKKVCLTILAFIGCFLMSCTFDGKSECFGPETEGIISIYTGFDYDSIRIYLGSQRICYGDMGGYTRDAYCKTSLDSGFRLITLESGGFLSDFYRVEEYGREKGVVMDEYPLSFFYYCTFNGVHDDVDMQMSTLTIETFHNGSVRTSKMENFVPGNELSVLIPVDDPVIWLDAGDVSPVKLKGGLLDWNRFECNDEWCLFREPYVENEFCYDKDD